MPLTVLDFSRGGFPVCLATEQERGSVGVRIQQAFPDTKVIKALNTTGSQIIVNPMSLSDGDHTAFLCGMALALKRLSRSCCAALVGVIFDLDDIAAAHGIETMAILWLRCWQQNGYFPAIGGLYAPDLRGIEIRKRGKDKIEPLLVSREWLSIHHETVSFA
jgi:hypothetical protein